jgi:hypothetical protein
MMMIEVPTTGAGYRSIYRPYCELGARSSRKLQVTDRQEKLVHQNHRCPDHSQEIVMLQHQD